jgi:hypothetical protein
VSSTAVPCVLLTRKRSQVQTLSRPPLFSLVKALSAPGGQRSSSAAAALRPQAAPHRTKWASGAGRHGTTTSPPTTQRGRHVSVRPMVRHHADDRQGHPAEPVSTCSSHAPPPPGPAARRRGAGKPAKRRTWATVDPRASQGRPTSHHRFPLGPMPAGDHAARGPRRHVDPLRPTEGRPTTPSHSRAQRGPDSAAAPRTPEACPSGHLDTGRPLDRLDGRPHGGTVDADRATTGLASVRTSSRPATIRWAARPCLGHGAWERSATQDGHGICAAS